LEHVLTDQQASLVKELESHVLKCIKDQNGNHVIQKAIERVPEVHINFIIEQVQGKAGELAVHNYGCRVIQRMLEHCSSPVRTSIIQELHNYGVGLYTDCYGNYVTQHIVVEGPPRDRDLIINSVIGDLKRLSTHKFASNVVEKCISSGSQEQRRRIMRTIIAPCEKSGETTLADFIKDSYGNYVVQKLLESDILRGADLDVFQAALQAELVKLKRSANVNGRQIANIEKRLPRQSPSVIASLSNSVISSVASPTSAGAPATGMQTPPSSSSGPSAVVPNMKVHMASPAAGSFPQGPQSITPVSETSNAPFQPLMNQQ
jgi:mRNA-binding protein PUF3